VIEKTAETKSPSAFRDVRRDRYGRPAKLYYETKSFIGWKSFCDSVCIDHEVDRFLPDLEVLISANDSSTRCHRVPNLGSWHQKTLNTRLPIAA